MQWLKKLFGKSSKEDVATDLAPENPRTDSASSAVKEELDAKVAQIEAMGIELELGDALTDAEKLEQVDELLGFFGDESFMDQLSALGTEELGGLEPAPTNLSTMTALIRAAHPAPEVAVQKLTELHDAGISLVGYDEGSFADMGLMEAFAVLAEQQLGMAIDHHDPMELGESLNTMLAALGKNEMPEAEFEQIEDAMFDQDDEDDYVWGQFAKKLGAQGLAMIAVSPIAGAWSDMFIFLLPESVAPDWVGKAYGQLTLLNFSQAFLLDD